MRKTCVDLDLEIKESNFHYWWMKSNQVTLMRTYSSYTYSCVYLNMVNASNYKQVTDN